MAGFEAVGEELPVGARRAGALVGADIAAVAGGAVGDRREIDPAETGPGVAVATLVAGLARHEPASIAGESGESSGRWVASASSPQLFRVSSRGSSGEAAEPT